MEYQWGSHGICHQVYPIWSCLQKKVPPNASVNHHYPQYLMAIWCNYPIFKHTHLESPANHPWFGRPWKICLNKSSSQFHRGFDGYTRQIHRWYILSCFLQKEHHMQ